MSSRKINILFAAIFFIYAVARVTSNLTSLEKPRELADTVSYLRISQETLSSAEFWTDARPFVFPLLLKLAGQDVSVAATSQLIFSILAWGLLAFFVATSFKHSWLKLFSFVVLLSLSLVRYLASWDYVMMTESLSISWLVLFIALGIWLGYGWKAYKVTLLVIAGFFLAFTRDTNAYLLLMLSGVLFISVLFRWSSPRILVLILAFAGIFLLNNYASDLGSRWVFPMNNNVGRRILPDSQALDFFRACGMPVTQNLLALTNEFANGSDRAFYNDPALHTYREWLDRYGKSCYMKWLVIDPVRSIGDAISQFENLIRFEKVSTFFARSYHPIIPNFVERFLYPKRFIIVLWFVLSFGMLLAMYKQAWKINTLWGAYILLCLTLIPHLFVTWHGDAMAPERHALSVGLQMALCFWFLIFLSMDILPPNGIAQIKRPNALQRLIHRLVMLRPVTAFFAPRLHHLDGFVLKLTNEKHTISELMGWNIIQLHTIGAKTGKPYLSPLIGVIDGEKIALIASSFGRQHNPGWYYNLKKNPECEIHLNGRTGKYLARETEGEERRRYWQMATESYAGYEKYRERALHRRIPVMVLEPLGEAKRTG